MKHSYLYDYLLQSGQLDSRYAPSLKFELDQRVYNFGDHFKYHKEQTSGSRVLRFKNMLKTLYLLYNKSLTGSANGVRDSRPKVINTAYFGLEQRLSANGYNTLNAPWQVSRNKMNRVPLHLHHELSRFRQTLATAPFIDLISPSFISRCEAIEALLSAYFETENLSAILVPNDIAFFENLSIRLFQQAKKPSFVFLHGLPARYNNIDDNRADYLLVWGKKIKENYVKAGIPADKIFITGHPQYENPQLVKPRFNLDNILVLTKAVNGGQHSDAVRLSDRGALISYLYSIQQVLQRCGVKSVRFRPHPSENINWYYRFIDRTFFRPCLPEPVAASIAKSGLVIGPSSTVLLESIFYGVNYLVYEPVLNNRDLINFPVVPPFDGSEEGIPVASSENALEVMIRSKTSVQPEVFEQYVQKSFDIKFLHQIIGR